MSDTSDAEARKERARSWFEALRDEICAAFEAIEDEAASVGERPGRFERKPWERPGGGGGVDVDHAGQGVRESRRQRV